MESILQTIAEDTVTQAIKAVAREHVSKMAFNYQTDLEKIASNEIEKLLKEDEEVIEHVRKSAIRRIMQMGLSEKDTEIREALEHLKNILIEREEQGISGGWRYDKPEFIEKLIIKLLKGDQS